MQSEAEQAGLDYTRQRLKEWGQYLQSEQMARLGLPSQSAHVDGYMGERQRQSGSVNVQAEEVERAMCRLMQTSPQIYHAVLCEYFYEHDLHRAASTCKCSKSMFRIRRSKGEYYIMAKLI